MFCYRDLRSVVCLNKCMKKLDCGYFCEGVCGKLCESVKCMRKMKYIFLCRYLIRVFCFERKIVICRVFCLC